MYGVIKICRISPTDELVKKVAGALGKSQYLLRLSARYPQGHLHNECYRVAEQRAPGSHQEAKGARLTTRCEKLSIWRSRMRRKNGICRSKTGGWR